jgi:hypothetical protein
MNTDFNDLEWHDADLQFLFIERQNPGERDIVKIRVIWPDIQSHISTIEFYDCYALTANMNFGIVACESILKAECFYNSEELDSIRGRWSKVGVDLSALKCFKISTNSTNSTISIFSLGFRVIDEGSDCSCQ